MTSLLKVIAGFFDERDCCFLKSIVRVNLKGGKKNYISLRFITF